MVLCMHAYARIAYSGRLVDLNSLGVLSDSIIIVVVVVILVYKFIQSQSQYYHDDVIIIIKKNSQTSRKSIDWTVTFLSWPLLHYSASQIPCPTVFQSQIPFQF